MLRAVLWHCFGLRSGSSHNESTGLFRDIADAGLVELLNGQEQALLPVKTHDFSPGTMVEPTIYLVRDGRAASVSYLHYHHDILNETDVTLDDIVWGRCRFGSWSNHVRAWMAVKRRQPSPLMILRYEDMIADLPTVVDALALLLEMQPTQVTIPSWETFHAANPKFFRVGAASKWRAELDGSAAEFDSLHGDVLAEYEYTD